MTRAKPAATTAPYLPSEEEIAQRAAAIRCEWTEDEELKRRYVRPPSPHIPTISVAEIARPSRSVCRES